MADSNDGHDEAFDRIVHEYYQAVEKGQRVDAKVFIDQHPEFKDDLESFFADLENLGDYGRKRAMLGTLAATPTNLEPRGETVGPGSSLTYIGEYRILEEIARGGMGVVFKARQEKLRRTVALKMILSGRLAGAAEVDRFQREARAAAALKHPNIVGVHEIGVHDGQHYFTMDYVESESLRERLREGSLAPQEAAELIETLARATHFAHTRGILHRDLKPANVLVDSNEQPYITDFGLAKPLAEVDDASQTDITRSGQIIGTPSYMAPEQAAAKYQLVGVASDIYSLGAILYACLSGRAPFVGESTVETIRQVIHDEPVPTRVLNPRVPKDLETICLKCLSKEPYRRYGTAEDLADDLVRFQEGRPVVARPISRISKVHRWAKRNPWTAATAVLLMLITISSPIVAWRELGLRNLAESNALAARGQASRANREADLARQRKREAEKTLARSKYFNALGHWDAGRAREAINALEDVLPEYRNIEWNIAYREFLGAEITFYGHTNEVTCVAISADDKWIASASQGEIRIWNAETGREHRTLPTNGRTTELKFLSDSRRLLSSHDTNLVVWDVIAGQSLTTIEETGPHHQVQCFAVSPDEKLLVVGTGRRNEPGRISFWDLSTRKRLNRIDAQDSGVARIDLCPDKKYVASVSWDNKFRIQHTESGEEAWQGTSAIADIAFHSSGYSIAILNIWGGLTINKVGRGSIINTFSNDSAEGANCVAWSPDSDDLAIGFVDGRIRHLNLTTKSSWFRQGHQGPVWDLAFSGDSYRVVSASADRTVRLWQRRNRATFKLTSDHDFRLAPSSNLQQCISVAISTDGTRLASGTLNNKILIWDTESFEMVQQISDHPDLIQDIEFFPDSGRIASACADKVIRVWSLESEQPLLTLPGHRGFLSDIEVSPDGHLIASADKNSEIRIWDSTSGQVLFSFSDPKALIQQIRFSSRRSIVGRVWSRWKDPSGGH